MRFKMLVVLEPASFFGLPEAEKTVLPASAEYVGPAVDTRTGQAVTHPTVPHYRQEADALKVQLAGAAVSVSFNDNFVTLETEASSLDEAQKRLTTFLERFVRHLSVEQGELFKYQPLQIEDDLRTVTELPRRRHLVRMSVTWYNIGELTDRIRRSYPRAAIEDQRLDRALLYYEHARLLYNLRGYADPFSAHHVMMLASAFLNLWKALCSIIGEPGTDKDYQRRYREYGLPADFLSRRVEPLYRIRCDEDVAHYSLEDLDADQLARSFVEAAAVCRDAITAYAESLLKASTPPSAA